MRLLLCGLGDADSSVTSLWLDLQRCSGFSFPTNVAVSQQMGCVCRQMFHCIFLSPTLNFFLCVLSPWWAGHGCMVISLIKWYQMSTALGGWLWHEFRSRMKEVAFRFFNLYFCFLSLMKKYGYQGGIESAYCSLTASGNAQSKGSPQWCKQDNCEHKCLFCNKKWDLILELNTQKDVTHFSRQLF